MSKSPSIPKTCDLNGTPGCAYSRLARLQEITATLYRRAQITSELLRVMVIDLGGTPDHPPDPAYLNKRQAARMRKAEREAMLNGLDPRKEEEMEEEMTAVPAVSEMKQGDFEKHLKLRHRGVKNESRHTVQHDAGIVTDHWHLPDARQRQSAARADIRYRAPDIEPHAEETIVTGEDDE
jgi:hypothetical protein